MKRRGGFTLVEMLVAIAIIVILLGMLGSAIGPLMRQVETVDSPAYRAARQVEAAFKDARRRAMETGIPHSVAFNRPAATGSAGDRRFMSNYQSDGDPGKPSQGDNFFAIIRHQKYDATAKKFTGPVVNPWDGWDTTVADEAAATTKKDKLLEDFAVTGEDAGRLPAGSGFYAFGAGIPTFESNNYRVWRWCWDDRAATSVADNYGHLSINSGAMIRNHEAVRIWIDAAGMKTAQLTVVDETSTIRKYGNNYFKGGVRASPYRLSARATFLPTGELIGYVGGRPAVLPDGALTPPFNYTLTPNGFHIVAVSESTSDSQSPPTAAANLKRTAETDYLNENYYLYFVGINQFTGETWVKNRYEMLDFAATHFPCIGRLALNNLSANTYAPPGAYDYMDAVNGSTAAQPRTNCVPLVLNTGSSNSCTISGSSSGYAIGAGRFINADAAANATLPTKGRYHRRGSQGSGNPEYRCCQQTACQWRAAVRRDANAYASW